MSRKQTVLRLTEDQDKMLDELSKMTQLSRNEVLTGLIVGEYDRLNGNPQMKAIMDQMKMLTDQMKDYTQGGKTAKT